MSILHDILSHNQRFVETKQYEQYRTTKFPDKKMVILTCMDTRLVELLPKAMNLKNGDAKIIKCAGAIVSHPFGSIMRSILVAVYELGASEVFVVGHHDCGMTGINPDAVLDKARKRGIADSVLKTLHHSGIDFNRWLSGFEHASEGVLKSVDVIRNHPLLPPGIPVHGLLIHPVTGKLDVLVDGYAS
mgnify:CR=1 FL=1